MNGRYPRSYGRGMVFLMFSVVMILILVVCLAGIMRAVERIMGRGMSAYPKSRGVQTKTCEGENR